MVLVETRNDHIHIYIGHLSVNIKIGLALIIDSAPGLVGVLKSVVLDFFVMSKVGEGQ